MASLNELPIIPACQSLCGDDDYNISWESFFGSLAAVCLESSSYVYIDAISCVKNCKTDYVQLMRFINNRLCFDLYSVCGFRV